MPTGPIGLYKRASRTGRASWRRPKAAALPVNRRSS
jgi:hypothetical protein